jgi:hypothetical protein
MYNVNEALFKIDHVIAQIGYNMSIERQDTFGLCVHLEGLILIGESGSNFRTLYLTVIQVTLLMCGTLPIVRLNPYVPCLA